MRKRHQRDRRPTTFVNVNVTKSIIGQCKRREWASRELVNFTGLTSDSMFCPLTDVLSNVIQDKEISIHFSSRSNDWMWHIMEVIKYIPAV